MTQTIAIVNEKGGTGKTTTAVNLSAALGELGKRILLVDLDGQAASSRWLGVEDDTRFADALWRGEAFEPIADVMPGVCLAPGSGKLDSVAHDLRPTQGGQLRKVLALVGGFDYIIIDCPPSLGNRLIGNALLAATHAIVPVEASILALDGLKILLTTFQDIRDGFGHEIILAGVLTCRYDARTRLSRLVLGELNRALPGKVFSTVIRENVRMRECPGSGKSILEYAPESHAAEDYRALGREFLAMPGQQAGATAGVSESELNDDERQAILDIRSRINSLLRRPEGESQATATNQEAGIVNSIPAEAPAPVAQTVALSEPPALPASDDTPASPTAAPDQSPVTAAAEIAVPKEEAVESPAPAVEPAYLPAKETFSPALSLEMERYSEPADTNAPTDDDLAEHDQAADQEPPPEESLEVRDIQDTVAQTPPQESVSLALKWLEASLPGGVTKYAAPPAEPDSPGDPGAPGAGQAPLGGPKGLGAPKRAASDAPAAEGEAAGNEQYATASEIRQHKDYPALRAMLQELHAPEAPQESPQEVKKAPGWMKVFRRRSA